MLGGVELGLGLGWLPLAKEEEGGERFEQDPNQQRRHSCRKLYIIHIHLHTNICHFDLLIYSKLNV